MNSPIGASKLQSIKIHRTVLKLLELANDASTISRAYRAAITGIGLHNPQIQCRHRIEIFESEFSANENPAQGYPACQISGTLLAQTLEDTIDLELIAYVV